MSDKNSKILTKDLYTGFLTELKVIFQVNKKGRVNRKPSLYLREIEKQLSLTNGQYPKTQLSEKYLKKQKLLVVQSVYHNVKNESFFDGEQCGFTPTATFENNENKVEIYVFDVSKIADTNAFERALLELNKEYRFELCRYLPIPKVEGEFISSEQYEQTSKLDSPICALEFALELNLNVWATPQPLSGEKKLPSFDLGWLPKPLSAITNSLSNQIQSPREFVAIPILTLLGSIIGHKIHVKPTGDDKFIVAPNLWAILIGEPGVKKSPAMESVLELLKPSIEKAEITFKKKLKRQKSRDDVHELMRKIALDTAKEILQEAAIVGCETGLVKAKHKAAKLLDNVNKQKTEKKKNRYLASDVTFASVFKLLSENSDGVLLFIDEIIGLLAKVSRSGNEELKALLLQAFNGFGIFEVDRVTKEHQSTQDAIVSVLGSIQPNKFLPFLMSAQEDSSENDGFINRFQLMIYATAAKEESLKPARNHKLVFDKLQGLVNCLVEHQFFDEDTDTKERALLLSDDAQQTFDRWWAAFRANAEENYSESVKAHFRKYHALPTKLALIFSVVNAYSVENKSFKSIKSIDLKSIKQAISLTEYLSAHAIFLMDVTENIAQIDAQRLARELATFNGSFTRRDVNQRNLSGIRRDTARAQGALDCLVEHNWLVRRRSSRTERYVINPFIKTDAICQRWVSCDNCDR